MTRKIARAVAAGVLAILAGAGCASISRAVWQPASPPSGPRPDFVFVLTDDLTWNLVSHMPHLLALQRAGTTMSSYYVVDSLCCPSRSAIFTGEYPHDDGVFTNVGSDGGYRAFNAHDNQQKSFAVALQKAGYRTALMGKYLNGYRPSDPVPPGWDQWDVTGYGYNEFGYILNQDGQQRSYGSDAKSYLTDVLSAKAASFIDSSASSGRPFMLEVATFAPHAPYTPAPRYAHAAQQLGYPETSAYDTLPADPPSWLKDRAPLRPVEQQQLAADFRKRVEADLAVDEMIGRLEHELQVKGLARNTYFVFSSDNGYHLGEYRLGPGKQTAFDTDIHVPLIVAGPGVPAGRAVSELTSNIDLAPTFESLAGLPVPASADGHSLAGLWHGQHPANWRQAILIEHHGPASTPGDPDRQTVRQGDPPSYEAVRTATALYVRYADGQQEYYDTANDPYELHNLAADGIPAALPKALSALAGCHGGAACWAAAHFG